MSSDRCEMATRAGHKPQQQVTREPDANANNNLDAATLQSMLDTLKSDIIGKIDATSVNLLAEIASVRQELITAIDPLQHTVDAHGGDHTGAGASCFRS